MEKQQKSNSWILPRLRMNRVRDVIFPNRANEGDAGLDFYVPNVLSPNEISNKNPNGGYSLDCVDSKVINILLKPHSRILIPSGIRVLMEPQNSMLQANNKSGVSTKKGLIFTAQVVDSPYTGEIHIGIVNTTNETITICPGEKLIQFIHIPIFLTNPSEIDEETYNAMAENWGTRGDKGFGSSDKEDTMSLEDELALRDAQYAN